LEEFDHSAHTLVLSLFARAIPRWLALADKHRGSRAHCTACTIGSRLAFIKSFRCCCQRFFVFMIVILIPTTAQRRQVQTSSFDPR